MIASSEGAAVIPNRCWRHRCAPNINEVHATHFVVYITARKQCNAEAIFYNNVLDNKVVFYEQIYTIDSFSQQLLMLVNLR